MKKKIFSTLACFMLCFATLFMVAGCGSEQTSNEEPKTPITQEQAMSVTSTAVQAMQSQDKILMTCQFTDDIEIKTLQIGDACYSYRYIDVSKMLGAGSYSIIRKWSEKINGQDRYTIYTEDEGKESGKAVKKTYSKETEDSAVLEFNNYFNLNELGEFFEAYTQGEQTYVVFTRDDDFKITLTIKNNMIRTIKIDFANSMVVNVTYGDEVTETIPTRPTDVSWIDLDSQT